MYIYTDVMDWTFYNLVKRHLLNQRLLDERGVRNCWRFKDDILIVGENARG